MVALITQTLGKVGLIDSKQTTAHSPQSLIMCSLAGPHKGALVLAGTWKPSLKGVVPLVTASKQSPSEKQCSYHKPCLTPFLCV